MKNLELYDLEVLSEKEQISIDGGIVGAALAAGIVVCIVIAYALR